MDIGQLLAAFSCMLGGSHEPQPVGDNCGSDLALLKNLALSLLRIWTIINIM